MRLKCEILQGLMARTLVSTTGRMYSLAVRVNGVLPMVKVTFGAAAAAAWQPIY